MKKNLIIIFSLAMSLHVFSQRLLTSWSQQNIENYTKEMYDDAQKLSASQLLEKNLKDQYWSEVFLTLNASINNFQKDTEYQKSLVNQITNQNVTKLKGTSRLIIWDRIASGEITFEGKGLVFENDLFSVAGRANQILQSLTRRNFGYVSVNSTEKDLIILRNKWLDFLNGKSVEDFKADDFKNSKIPEISSLQTVKALIISLQDNSEKDKITKNCLSRIYKLNEMPKEKDSPAVYCNPDTYTFAYLTMLFGEEKRDESKDSKWWMNFWIENQNKLIWNSEKGIYKIKL